MRLQAKLWQWEKALRDIKREIVFLRPTMSLATPATIVSGVITPLVRLSVKLTLNPEVLQST
jgi:hypothetical protein